MVMNVMGHTDVPPQSATSIRCWIRFVKPPISGIYVTIHVTTNSGYSEEWL